MARCNVVAGTSGCLASDGGLQPRGVGESVVALVGPRRHLGNDISFSSSRRPSPLDFTVNSDGSGC